MKYWLMPLVALALTVPGAAVAQEKSAMKPGFSFSASQPVKIVVFRPDVSVGSQSAGGLNEPNAEWTEQARKELVSSLESALKARSGDMRLMPELTGADALALANYRSLFKAVTGTVVSHRLFVGNRLPTKLDKFDWSLGSGVSKLADAAGGADYGLFFLTNDSYGSAGRKAAQLVGAMFGAYIPSGVHAGYAGLVDLKTGELVWINADMAMGGDVRTAEGAAKRVSQLLEDFPSRGGTAATKVSR